MTKYHEVSIMVKAFVSSTCMDVKEIRKQLDTYLCDAGIKPVLSDFGDVFYDPALHTHTSCVEEVAKCDMLIFIIGRRFGGLAVPEAYEHMDKEALSTLLDDSFEKAFEQRLFSITQLEVLKAIEMGIPVWTFVEQSVYNDHNTYQKNQDNDTIIYGSIEKSDTAKYIFEFINLIRRRRTGNCIFTFEYAKDIERELTKQFSGILSKGLKSDLTIFQIKKETKTNITTNLLVTLGFFVICGLTIWLLPQILSELSQSVLIVCSFLALYIITFCILSELRKYKQRSAYIIQHTKSPKPQFLTRIAEEQNLTTSELDSALKAILFDGRQRHTDDTILGYALSVGIPVQICGSIGCRFSMRYFSRYRYYHDERYYLYDYESCRNRYIKQLAALQHIGLILLDSERLMGDSDLTEEDVFTITPELLLWHRLEESEINHKIENTANIRRPIIKLPNVYFPKINFPSFNFHYSVSKQSDKSWFITVILAILFGWLGIDSMYLNNKKNNNVYIGRGLILYTTLLFFVIVFYVWSYFTSWGTIANWVLTMVFNVVIVLFLMLYCTLSLDDSSSMCGWTRRIISTATIFGVYLLLRFFDSSNGVLEWSLSIIYICFTALWIFQYIYAITISFGGYRLDNKGALVQNLTNKTEDFLSIVFIGFLFLGIVYIILLFGSIPGFEYLAWNK